MIWESSHSNHLTVCSNLNEGISLINQRSLVLSAGDIGAGGKLIFEFDQQGVPIKKLHLAWLKEEILLTDQPETAPVALPKNHSPVSFEAAMGIQPPPPKTNGMIIY